MDKIQTVKSEKNEFTWLNITGAGQEEILYLRRKYKFEDIDLDDSYNNAFAQRPKFLTRANYNFLILQFPVYNKKTKTIQAEEIDFFFNQEYLITIHNNKLPPLIELFNLCSSDSFYRQQFMSSSNIQLLYEVILRLQEYCYPILDHISLDIKNIESNIFNHREKQMIKDISYIKRNIYDTKRILEAHKNALQKILKQKSDISFTKETRTEFNNLIEHSKNLWDILSSQKETIDSLEYTNATLVESRLNDIIKTLTIFSVIVFPLTLLAAIFGMNTVSGMPFMKHPYGFWIVIVIMLLGTLAMLIIFKKKKWL